MALPQLPTASEIRIASRLRPEQVSVALADVAALESDIDDRITEQSDDVEMQIEQAASPLAWPFSDDTLAAIYPNYSGDQITGINARQTANAKLIVKLLAIGDLYDSAGQLNERYQREADNYMRRGEKLLEQLIQQINWQVGQMDTTGTADGDGLHILTIEVGDC